MTTLQAIGFTAAGGAAVMSVSFAAFGLALRKSSIYLAPRCTARHPHTIYHPGEVLPTSSKRPHPDQDRGGPWFGWIPWTLGLSYDEMLRGVRGTGTRRCGRSGRMLAVNLDAIVLFRFHALCLRVALVATVLCLGVILPVNLTARCFNVSDDPNDPNYSKECFDTIDADEDSDGKNDVSPLTDFEKTTLANIPPLEIDGAGGTSKEGAFTTLKDYGFDTIFGSTYATLLARLYAIVLCSWIVTWYSCRLLRREWSDCLAMRRVYYLEADHWSNRIDELRETVWKEEVDDSDEEDEDRDDDEYRDNGGADELRQRRAASAMVLPKKMAERRKQKKRRRATKFRRRDPWIPHPEQRDTVPNIELYSVLVGGLPALPSEVVDQDDLEDAVGFSRRQSIDWQLAVATAFFDHSVPNQPGFSSSVAAVTILPDAPELAKAWRKWYTAAAALRRLRFLRSIIADRRRFDLEEIRYNDEDESDDEEADGVAAQKVGGRPLHPSEGGGDLEMARRSVVSRKEASPPVTQGGGGGFSNLGAIEGLDDSFQQTNDRALRLYSSGAASHQQLVDEDTAAARDAAITASRGVQYLRDVFGSSYDEEVESHLFQALEYGPEQTAVYSREMAQGAAACCPNGCGEDRLRHKAGINELLALEEEAIKRVEKAHYSLRFAQLAAAVSVLETEDKRMHLPEARARGDLERHIEEDRRHVRIKSQPNYLSESGSGSGSNVPSFEDILGVGATADGATGPTGSSQPIGPPRHRRSHSRDGSVEGGEAGSSHHRRGSSLESVKLPDDLMMEAQLLAKAAAGARAGAPVGSFSPGTVSTSAPRGHRKAKSTSQLPPLPPPPPPSNDGSTPVITNRKPPILSKRSSSCEVPPANSEDLLFGLSTVPQQAGPSSGQHWNNNGSAGNYAVSPSSSLSVSRDPNHPLLVGLGSARDRLHSATSRDSSHAAISATPSSLSGSTAHRRNTFKGNRRATALMALNAEGRFEWNVSSTATETGAGHLSRQQNCPPHPESPTNAFIPDSLRPSYPDQVRPEMNEVVDVEGQQGPIENGNGFNHDNSLLAPGEMTGPTRRRANTDTSGLSDQWAQVERILSDDATTPSATEAKYYRRSANTGIWKFPSISSCWSYFSEKAEIRRVTKRVTEEVAEKVAKESTFAVVTFTSRQAAVAARHCLADGRGANRWISVQSIPVPPLADAAPCDFLTCRGCCRPVTLNVNKNQQRVRRFMSIAILVTIYIFYTVPIFYASSFVKPEKLYEIWPELEEIVNENVLYSEILSGIVPALLFTLFFALCPLMFKAIANFGSNAKSVQNAEKSALRYYWWFMVFTAFSGGSLVTMVLNAVNSGRVEDNFRELMRSIGEAIPTQVSAVWINWIIVRTTMTLPLQYMLQINSFLFAFLGWKCCARCVVGGGPGGPIPYRIYIDSGVVYLCLVALAPASPLVAPAALLYFLYCQPLWRRNCIFMYRPKFDTGGLRWPFLSDVCITSLLVGQILLVTMMMLKEAIGPAIMAAIPTLPTILFRKYSRKRFLRAYKDAGLLQTSLLDGWDNTAVSSMKKREEFRQFLVDAHKAAYIPVCIAGGATSILTAEPAVVVPADNDDMVGLSEMPMGEADAPAPVTPNYEERVGNQHCASLRRMTLPRAASVQATIRDDESISTHNGVNAIQQEQVQCAQS